MLEVKGLSAAYGQHPALNKASVRVGKGEIVVILGANGAGKSTLLKAISGICEGKVTGSVRMNGHELVGMKPDRIVEEGIALVPEGRGIFGDLTVEENLTLGAYSERAKDAERTNLDRVYALFPKLLERRRQVARTMSGGEQQMVAIGRAMMSNPAILTLDEPSLGLSPLLSKELFQSLRAVRDTGIGILLVEQNAKASLAIADRGYLLENTEIIHEDAAASLAKDPAVQKAYLGGAAAKGGAGKAKPQANAMPAPSAPRPAKGPSPSDIAAQAMSGLAPARPAKPAPAPEPAPRPAPPPAPPVARPAPRPAPAATPTATGIDTASIVAKAASQSSRKGGAPALPPRPAPMPEPPKPARASQPTRPMPDLGHHSDRLREVLTEIETAAQRARDRSRTRTRGKP
ncbi:branched-chain amino acid transport system ATP-binding protein [Maritimibacter alkaliphilus HTCC2654]|uniref:ABC branched-chain amino acid family transporter, ATPase subunit n=1 Tax=Maritimibacter alkaliphilus HTCC2654 TaxID=314271 RepID=A3VIK0_9RHOB|nr:ABC transporter ATP-binding protein [Maritimibacter alkaliphilus]EAQ11931.1 ABC branched-chain amino acid family transporter, ATPase subunit [Rhodobacterales bacterium HTCC2654] [Maritimibacter alkaliphilus HTCC2654]TYP85648.1 branched-chain amino acid transport system ATP-binding protein [Maritimibacter alkaliphilus HTCC2654]